MAVVTWSFAVRRGDRLPKTLPEPMVLLLEWILASNPVQGMGECLRKVKMILGCGQTILLYLWLLPRSLDPRRGGGSKDLGYGNVIPTASTLVWLVMVDMISHQQRIGSRLNQAVSEVRCSVIKSGIRKRCIATAIDDEEGRSFEIARSYSDHSVPSLAGLLVGAHLIRFWINTRKDPERLKRTSNDMARIGCTTNCRSSNHARIAELQPESPRPSVCHTARALR